MSGATSKFGVPLDYTTGQDVTLQPKLKYRFRVRFLGLGSLSSTTLSFDAMQQVIRITKPKINFNVKEISTYAGTVNLINKPKYEPLLVTFRDDSSNSMISALDSQLMKQYDFYNGRYSVSGGAYKFVTIIETLDANNHTRAIDSFQLEGCLISNFDYGDMDSAVSDVVEVQATIHYDNIIAHTTEINGIEDPIHLLWMATSSPSAYASASRNF